MRTRLVFLASTLLFSACTQSADPIDENRKPLGKADASGSCAMSDCDGQSLGGTCWCDTDCTFYGDCCSDKVAVCDAPSGQNCGGFAGLLCAQDEFCQYDAAAQCGAADQLGTCQPTPQACILLVAEVCGCDGVTYSNSCFAAQAGTSVVHDGACAPTAQTCGGLLGAACGAGEYCKWEPADICGAADQLGTCEVKPDACIAVFDPVCGCNDQTYSNSCVAANAGVSVAAPGPCN